MNPLLSAILKDIVVPEITSFIHSKYNTTGELPTQEELQLHIDNLSAKIVMKSEAFLNQLRG
jgi:hypothetical protein